MNVDRFYAVRCLDQFRSFNWWPQAGERVLSQKQRAALDTFLASSPSSIPTIICGGGQAANFAITAAQCGLRSTLFSTIGVDSASSIALTDLSQVDLSFLNCSNGTTEAFIFVEPSGTRDILISPSEEPIPSRPEVLSNTNWDHIHFTSLPLRKHVDIQVRIAALARRTAGRSLDIGALYAKMGRRRLKKLLRAVNVLFATEQELEIFTGVASDNAPELLFGEGVKMVCCKRGAAGARLYRNNGTVLDCVAPAVQSVDTTGAGDVFAAVFVAACLRGATDIVALQVATNLASKSVTVWGRGAYPRIEGFLDALKSPGT